MADTARLGCLFRPLDGLEAFTRLTDGVNAAEISCLYGPDDTQRAHLIAALLEKTGRQALLIESNELASQRMAESLTQLMTRPACFLPARDVTFLRAAASSRDLSMRRISAMGDCATGKAGALVVSADALLDRLPPADKFRAGIIHVTPEARFEPEELVAHLTGMGYERVQLVEARGQCALRGGILDVYPVGEELPLRLEFFDDEIDSMRSFDVLTQRSTSDRAEATLLPASECLAVGEDAIRAVRALDLAQNGARRAPSDDRQKDIERKFGLSPFSDFMRETGVGEVSAAASSRFDSVRDALAGERAFNGAEALLPVLLDYTAIPSDYLDHPILIFDQPDRLRERYENRVLEYHEQFMQALERGEALPAQASLLQNYDDILSRVKGRVPIVICDTFLRTQPDFAPTRLLQVEGRAAAGYHANIRELAQDIAQWRMDGWVIALLSGGSARGRRLEGALGTQNCRTEFFETVPAQLSAGQASILPVAFGRGFLYPEIRFAVLSEGDIYGIDRKQQRAAARTGDKLEAFTELKVGDFVVHENHGIGQYMGTVRLTSDGATRDFLHIRYAGSDKLYVPTDQLSRVQKYIGSEGDSPKLNRLSGGEWQRQKSRVKASVQQIAGELIKLYAHRESAPGYAFLPDTPWQREFEDNFPFEETPDQLTAIADIKRDMEQPRIMDRLLCGDVGYGKTEVALRAIFKCVMSGKQAVLLAPTTVLVQQHYATMMNRFSGFPIRVDSLSRFKTASEQKQIISRLKSGEVDVVVGTHRLLAKDVEFKDMGLLVVDEEQRFGVSHKEKIKQMKHSVDVLTLTATPIPRTLHMSMVGIRDMSLLQSPPEERFPVQTYVMEYTDNLARDAILRELARGGQVYVLYNRVQTIEIMYQRLSRLVPEARIVVGHGQMREHALEEVMLDFYDGKYDVLLCTTIIEAGLDVPRCNTLIVCDADRFGLSQLYQLRGRVGRSNRLAYAYLTVSPSRVLTENADKRLSAIREFTQFGSGFRVAMRDLEIRGAGNILGAEQSGFMASVGYDLYVKMIDESVRELRGDAEQGDIETHMEIKVDAYLPEDYVSNDLLRIEMYKKIASIRTRSDREDMVEELIDRFGDPARPVMNLICVAQLRALCAGLGIDSVTNKAQSILMRFSLSADIDLMRVLTAVRPEKYLRVIAGNPPSLLYDGIESLEKSLEDAVRAMERVSEAFYRKTEEDA